MANDRRRRFLAYFDKKYKGNRAELIRDSGLTKGRIAQLFDEGQAFGEHAARNLAHALQLPEDFFEKDPAPAGLSQEALEMAAALERLSPDERERLRLLYKVASGAELPQQKKPVIDDASRPHDELVDTRPGALGELGELGPLVNRKRRR
jgi:hypothetical protein